jgi:hypothetical protein
MASSTGSANFSWRPFNKNQATAAPTCARVESRSHGNLAFHGAMPLHRVRRRILKQELPMDPQAKAPVTPDQPKSNNELPAYTPGFGRRLLMFLLCLLGLIVVWSFVWFDSKK